MNIYDSEAMRYKQYFDGITYELNTVGLPNIKWARHTNWWTDKKVEPNPIIGEFMDNFIREAAKKHPEWTFINSMQYSYTPPDSSKANVEMYDFDVFHDKEYLGSLGRDHFRGGWAYTITNHRIQSKRERGHGAKTADLRKALRIVDKEFARKSYNEMLNELADKGRGKVTMSLHSHAARAAATERYFVEHLTPHLVANFDTYRDLAVAEGAKPDKLDVYGEQLEARQVASNITDKMRAGDGLFVIVANNVYAARDSGPKDAIAYHTWTSDTVPDVVRRKIGLLKLVEPDHFLAEVGYRIDDNSFLIMKEPEDAE